MKLIKLAVGLLLVFAIAIGLCMGTGAITGFIYKDEFAAILKQSEDAQAEILAETKLKATVSASYQSSLNNGLTTSDVVVTFEFVPPTADRQKLQDTVDLIVHRHFPKTGPVTLRGPGWDRRPPADEG